MRLAKINRLNKFINLLTHLELYIYKPTKSFKYLSIFALVIWIFLGPISWRHVDDYIPLYTTINNFIENNQSNIISFEPLKLLLHSIFYNNEWGVYPITYPHSWNFLYQTISIPLFHWGINYSRWAMVFIGFISSLTIALLLSNLISKLIIAKKNTSNLKDLKRIRNISDFVSVLTVCFNPEIMLHAITNMPYQLPAITTLVIINMIPNIVPFESRDTVDKIDKLNFFKINYLFSLCILWASLLLGFQSIYLILSLLFMLFIFNLFGNNLADKLYQLQTQVKSNSIKKLNYKTNFIFIAFVLILLKGTENYLAKLFYLIKTGQVQGGWANGYDNLYNISIRHIASSKIIPNIFHILSRITSLSIYPYREGQWAAAILGFALILLSIMYMIKSSSLSKIILFYLLSNIFISLVIALAGKNIIAPTRHNIYLFPCFWIPYLFLIVNYSYLIIENFSKSVAFLMSATLLFYSIGLISSHKLIDYSKNQIDLITAMATKADKFAQYDPFSLFWTHGNIKNNMFLTKTCSSLDQSYLGEIFFIYSHREPFNLNNLQQRKTLENSSNGCLAKADQISILESYEFESKRDIEMDNLIYNGGSGIYSYLIKVDSK